MSWRDRITRRLAKRLPLHCEDLFELGLENVAAHDPLQQRLGEDDSCECVSAPASAYTRCGGTWDVSSAYAEQECANTVLFGGDLLGVRLCCSCASRLEAAGFTYAETLADVEAALLAQGLLLGPAEAA